MVTLSVRTPTDNPVPAVPHVIPLSDSHLLVAEVVESLGTVRDDAHLQYCLYLAQEFRLLPRRYWFASDGKAPGFPYSHVLHDHVRTLVRRGVVRDDAGALRRAPEGPHLPRETGGLDQRLAALSLLGAGEAAAFAHAVFILSRRGCHPSNEHFNRDLLSFLAATPQDAERGQAPATRTQQISAVCLSLRNHASMTVAPARAS